MRHHRRAIRVALISAALVATFSACSRRPPTPMQEIDQGSRRTTGEGAVVGFRGAYGSNAWLGIPFAQPPVGDLRWRAPQPPAPRSEVLQATALPPRCPQIASPFGGISDVSPGLPTGDEDCLYLNIYAPTRDSGGDGPALPVMFWIHGGGNVVGHSGFYDGGNLAATEDVVVVVVQYRLGPLGWLRHRALADGADPLDRSGNFGTLDLIRGLEWVRDNIGSFGGDPSRVTIFGESAGARNVVSLLLSPPARGLFHRAIAQSGGTDIVSPVEAESFTDAAPPGLNGSSNELLVRLLQLDATAADRAAAKSRLAGMTNAETAAYLRSKSPGEMLAAYLDDGTEGLIRVPNVFADGTVVSKGNALENFAKGNAAQVPAMFGTNRDEQKIFMFADPRWSKRLLWILPRMRDPDLYAATADTMSRLWAVRGAVAPANARSQAGGPPTFVYRWDWDEEPTFLGTNLAEMVGAAHAMEIPFIFGHYDLGPKGNVIFSDDNEAGRLELSRAMMSYWANFARTGEPGRGSRGELPSWVPWGDTNRDKMMILDTTEGGGIRATSEVESREQVFADLATDPRVSTLARRCRVYQTLKEWTREVDDTRYREIGCGEAE